MGVLGRGAEYEYLYRRVTDASRVRRPLETASVTTRLGRCTSDVMIMSMLGSVVDGQIQFSSFLCKTKRDIYILVNTSLASGSCQEACPMYAIVQGFKPHSTTWTSIANCCYRLNDNYMPELYDCFTATSLHFTTPATWQTPCRQRGGSTFRCATWRKRVRLGIGLQ